MLPSALAGCLNERWLTSVICGLDILQVMAEVGMPLLIHGEVTTAGVDIFDKEARFIEEVIKVHGSFLVARHLVLRRLHPC